ncbi:hypothetical protein ABN09_00755 [Morganella morganii]|nr:hypothetical protein ABN09_00755 [Morganella morganii]
MSDGLGMGLVDKRIKVRYGKQYGLKCSLRAGSKNNHYSDLTLRLTGKVRQHRLTTKKMIMTQ